MTSSRQVCARCGFENKPSALVCNLCTEILRREITASGMRSSTFRPVGSSHDVQKRSDFLQIQRSNQRQSFVLAAVLLFLLVAACAGLGYLFEAYVTYGERAFNQNPPPLDWRRPERFVVFGATIGFILALFALLLGYMRGEDAVRKMASARPADELEAKQIHNVLDEICLASGMARPSLLIVDDPYPNAFATGLRPQTATVGVTTGLLQRLNREQTMAVVAHEMAHIRHRDTEFQTLLASWVGIIFFLREMFLKAMNATEFDFRVSKEPMKSKHVQSQGFLPAYVVAFLGWLVMSALSGMAYLLIFAASRKREMVADMTSVEWTRNPIALAEALQRIHSYSGRSTKASRGIQHLYIDNPFRHSAMDADALFSTHPPVLARINLLRNIAGLPALTETHLLLMKIDENRQPSAN